MFRKSARILQDQRGIAFLSVLITIIIVVFLSAMIGRSVITSQTARAESEIQTTKGQLEQASRSYLLANGKYATDSAKSLKDYPLLTAHHNFQKILMEEYSLTDEEVSSRLQVVDISSLQAQTYFTGEVKKPKNYVIDKITGIVYYIDDEATLDDLRKLAEELLKDSNDVIDLSVIGDDVFELTVDGRNMTRVIATAQDGNKIILGGGVKNTDDIKLMLVEFSIGKDGDKSDRKLTDLTSKVAKGSLKTPITDIRLIQPGTVLAHYYHDNELKYELINY